MLQVLVVAVLVAGCFFYAAWALMPASARKRIAALLLARPLPAFMAEALRPHAAGASGCGCAGCDRSAKPKAARSGATPITFHPRRQR
jgi:hypothetical protein